MYYTTETKNPLFCLEKVDVLIAEDRWTLFNPESEVLIETDALYDL